MTNENVAVSRPPTRKPPDNSGNKAHSQMYDPIHRIKEYLSRHYYLRYNVISNNIEWVLMNPENGNMIGTYQNMNDERFHSIYIEIQKSVSFRMSHQILATVLASDFVIGYNPFREFFDSLPAWDATQPDYIVRLTEAIPTNDREYLQDMLTKWLVGLVACSLDPNVENHIVLLLKGGQGVGKTRFLRRLISRKLSQYIYEGNINPNNKEHERHLAEKLLLIMDEFDMKSDRQSEALKSLITRNSITARKPYAKNPSNFPRVASFAGTTNRDFFLKDRTGNRRFAVIDVIGEIDNREIDYLDHVYAQALYLYNSGFEYFLNSKDIQRVNEVNENFMESSYEEELLLATYRAPEDMDDRDNYLTATDIAKEIATTNRIPLNGRFVQKIGIALSTKGFPSGKTNGAKKYGVKYNT